MKKPRKKYNPRKNASKLASNALRNTAILFTTGEDFCKLICTRTRKLLPINDLMRGAIQNFPYKWSVYIAAFGIDQNQRPYMKSDIVLTREPYFQHELVEILNVKHGELNRSMNNNHFIGCGWIASPHGTDFSEEEAFEMFNEIGAFNRRRDPHSNDIYVTD